MKNLLITLLSIILSNSIFAQNKVEITGQVKDFQTKNVLEFCSISVLNLKDSLISGGTTDAKGFFVIPVDRGTYKIITSFIGYNSDTIKSTDVYDNKFLGVIRLKSNVNSLNEVLVVANANQNLLDRDIQIVTDKMKVGASNAKEVLEKVNGVTYDRYSNSIKVDNNDKVIILVDGMQKDQEYIKNLSPDRLKKIEVIRDPGGRYALEGYSAVINIILKKDYQGTDIFVSDRSMTDIDASKTAYIPVQNDALATVNYVYNKLNLYTSARNLVNHFNLPSTSKKEYSDGFNVEKLPINNEMNTNVHEMYNNFTFGVDYYLNPKHTISFESNLWAQPFSKNHTKEIYNVIYSQTGNVFMKDTTESSSQTGNINSSNSIFYIGKLDENNEINANFNYSFYKSNFSNIYREYYDYELNEEGNDKKNQGSFNFDFYHNYKNKSSLQLGLGSSLEVIENNINSTFSIYNFEKKTSSKNRIYAYYSWQKGKKITYKFGLAVEFFAAYPSKLYGIYRRYTILQPYADLKYIPSKSFSTKLKYRSWSNYPNISQTNPLTVFVDAQTVKVGNPDLRPDLTHKISLQNDILGGFITLEPYFNFSNNLITESGKLQYGTFEYSYGNAGNYKNYGVEGRMNLPLGNKFILQPNFDFYNSSIEFEGKTNEFFDWKMSSQLIYQNEKTATVAGFQFQKNMSKYITAQGYNKWDNDFWIAFVQQPFLKQKLSVMLLYFLPINLGVDFEQGSYIKTAEFAESKIGNISFLKNMIMLEISYRFNKGKSVTKTEKKIEQINENGKKGMF